VSQMQFVCGILKTLLVCGGGLYLSNELLHTTFGFTVREIWSFKDFGLTLGMLLAIANATKFAQNYQILPKDN
jgi:hypothetical protein